MIQDRKYQNDAISGLQWAVENGAQRVMLVAPPGAGKTKIASDYFATVTGHVVAFSHRKEVRDQITRAFTVAGVQRFTAHCVRHFVATRLKDSRQATPFQIQAFLGHQNLSTTERYLHELDVDRGVADIMDDSESPISNKIEPQIEPRPK